MMLCYYMMLSYYMKSIIVDRSISEYIGNNYCNIQTMTKH